MKEQIIEILTKEDKALDIIELNDLLGLKNASDLAELSRTLESMVEDYSVYHTKKDRYMLFKNNFNLKVGKLSVTKKGFGFVILENQEDIYITKENLNGAVHDDIVLAEITKSGTDAEGKIIKIIKREFKNLVGEIIFEDNKIMLDLDDEKRDFTIVIDPQSAKDCVEGHKVSVEIIKELNNKNYLAKVIKILGHKNDPGVDILSIAYKYGIFEEFNDNVLDEVEKVPVEVRKEELVGRKDFTGITVFTIDGDDTKDIDDALSLEMIDGKYRLGVHIADVSYYVKDNSAIGMEAYERGTSSYLANTVIPMLPHKLSNGICSLNENVLRLTLSCVMDFDELGNRINYEITSGYIKSSKKMTYNCINDILERNIVAPGYEEFKDTLLNLNKLSNILRKKMVAKGYIDFELDEAKIIQDDTGKCIDVSKRTRESGEILIENFMIAANECVAEAIYNMDLPFIYRVHTEPKKEKVEDFLNLVKQLGYRITGNLSELKPKTMQNILEQLKDKKEFPIFSSLLLRSMAKAEYHKENLRHFGLASFAYTHFTSPIRRLPDLIVHRLLKNYLVNNDYSKETINYYDNNLSVWAEHASAREVAAINAERDVSDMKMAEYMEGHIGEEFEGIIDTVTNFGMFIRLDNLIEGLVHMSALKGDYFVYVPELLSLIGKSTKKTYRIGDSVKIKVVAASKENATIDFELVGEEKDGNKK